MRTGIRRSIIWLVVLVVVLSALPYRSALAAEAAATETKAGSGFGDENPGETQEETTSEPSEQKPAEKVSLKVQTPGNKVPTYEYQKAKDFVLNVTNNGDSTLENIRISPVLKEKNDQWPFKTDYQKYEKKIASLGAGESGSVSFSFTERDDVKDMRYQLVFHVTAKNADGKEVISEERTFYVNTTAKPGDEKKDGKDADGKKDSGKDPKDSKKAGEEAQADVLDMGGVTYDDSSYSYSGGSDSGNASVPRVIVTGFTTNPGEVFAGSDFTLIVHLRNTAKNTKVQNLLFELTAPTEGADEATAAPAFLPSSGSNSIYLESIAAGGVADIAINLNAKADLVQKPYSINLSMKYEDKNAAQVEGEASISIPVRQNARFEFSTIEVVPETIAVGEEANVTCSLYNLGRIKLYNAKATFAGDCIETEEVYLGNLEPGSSTSIDAMLTGTKASGENGKVTMTLSYEDEGGAVSTAGEEFTIAVEEVPEADMEAAGMAEQESAKKGVPILPIGIGAALAAGAGALAVRKRKKAKNMKSEEEEFLDELAGSDEDELR